jgi:hypothetical protein
MMSTLEKRENVLDDYVLQTSSLQPIGVFVATLVSCETTKDKNTKCGLQHKEVCACNF